MAATWGSGAQAADFANACAGITSTIGGGGPPSITASEFSTSQAIELVRRRRLAVAEACPAGTINLGGVCQLPPAQIIPVSAPAPAPVVQVAPASATAPAPPVQAPAGPPTATKSGGAVVAKVASKPRPVTTSPATQPVSYAPLSEPAAIGATRGYATWAEAFIDFERHDGLNPGGENDLSRRTVGGGYIGGMDWTQRSGAQGFQVGLLSGHTQSNSRFSDNTTNEFSIGGDVRNELTSQDVSLKRDGTALGVFGSYFSGAFSADALFKVDIMDLERRGSVRERVFSKECAVDFALLGEDRVSLNADSSVTDYTLAGNLNYRIDLNASSWVEPTVGLRYTYSDYGSGADAMGFKDGSVFRVQGGLRLGNRMLTAQGYLVTTTLTGLLYSDVAVSGLVNDALFSDAVAKVDEGKLRVLGALASKVDMPTGYSYYGQVEVRGGEEVVGLGGKVGMRMEW